MRASATPVDLEVDISQCGSRQQCQTGAHEVRYVDEVMQAEGMRP